MTRKTSVEKLQQLVEIRRNERQLARGEVFEASHSERRANDIHTEAEIGRDLAFVSWVNAGNTEHIDLGVQPLMAQLLIDQEAHFEQSSELLSLAKDRLERRQARWKLSDLNLQTAKKVEKKAEQELVRKKEEARLSDITDRHCFESIMK